MGLNALIYCIRQKNWIFYFGFDDWPQLLDEHAEAATLLLGLRYLLVEKLLAVFQQLNQLFVLALQLLDLLIVSSLFFNVLADDLLLLVKL